MSVSRAPSSASSFELLPMYSSLSTRSPSQMTELPTHEMSIRSGTPSTRSQSRGSLVAETSINRQQLASEFQDLVRIGTRSTNRPSSIQSSARPTSQNQVALGPYPANTPPEPRSLILSRSSSTQSSARPTSQNQLVLGQRRQIERSSARPTSQNQMALNRPPSTQSSARPTSQNQIILGQQQSQLILGQQQSGQLIPGQQQSQLIPGQQSSQLIPGQQQSQLIPGQYSQNNSRQGFRPPTAPPAISNGQLGYQPALPYGGIALGQPEISNGARQYRAGQMEIDQILGQNSLGQGLSQPNIGQPTVNQNILGQPPLLYPLLPQSQQNLPPFPQQQPIGPPPIYSPQIINQTPVQRPATIGPQNNIDPEMVWDMDSPGIEIQTAGVQRGMASEQPQNGLFVSLPSPQQATAPSMIQPISTVPMSMVPMVSCGCQQPLTVYRRWHHHCGRPIIPNIHCCGCRHLDPCLPTCSGIYSAMPCPHHNHCV